MPRLCIGSRHEAPPPSSERSEARAGLTRRAQGGPAGVLVEYAEGADRAQPSQAG